MDTGIADTPAATTTLGTPASPKWDADWLAEVERVETELDRRICGAHTPAWTPCKLASTHPNGRCRFHGGHANIGAPDGNRNAWIHGLYSRRLQQCGEHCPLWKHCPMAGNDVMDLKEPERPHCVYEKEEYDSLVAALVQLGAGAPDSHSETVRDHAVVAGSAAAKQSLPDATAHPEGTAPEPTVPASPREPSLVERNVVLFQIMLTRAQAALRVARLTDETRAYTLRTNYRMQSPKVAALVQAQLLIARELRQWLKLLPEFDPRHGHPVRRPHTPSTPPAKRDISQSLPMRMMKLMEETDGALEEALGIPYGTTPFKPRFPKRNPPPDPPPPSE